MAMDGVNIGGTPFNVLMQQAVKMKTARHAVDRRRFDSLPRFAQNSMFGPERLEVQKTGGFEARLGQATTLKEEGNKIIKASGRDPGALLDCAMKYENALTMFRYIENTNPEWKRSCIDDNDMVHHDFITGENEEEGTAEERALAVKLCLSCYLNLAYVYTKMGEWNNAIEAADYALELEPRSAKAYYRRAVARHTPVSAGATEMEQAMEDLSRALELAPDDGGIKRAHTNLKREIRRQRKTDKTTFGNLFDRGELYVDEDIDISERAAREGGAPGEPEKERPWEEQLAEAEAILKHLEENEEYEKAKEVERVIAEAKERREKGIKAGKPKAIDFRNPTPEMIADAKSKGIDLTDPRVVDMLVEMQEEKEAEARGEAPPKKKASRGHGDEKDEKDADDGDTLTPAEVLEALEHIDDDKVRDMLLERGIGNGTINTHNKFKLAEQIAAEMAETKYRRKSKRSTKESWTKLGFWQRTMLIAVVVLVFRLWHMGLLWEGLGLLADAAGWEDGARWFHDSYSMARGGREQAPGAMSDQRTALEDFDAEDDYDIAKDITEL
mmetsp:Transcript_38952/g.122024  ORF Transcript_38952/g.122024 Transcript_38952/m.122024 type:complete len:556 (-) Transcript_38952:63-1730(-)